MKALLKRGKLGDDSELIEASLHWLQKVAMTNQRVTLKLQMPINLVAGEFIVLSFEMGNEGIFYLHGNVISDFGSDQMHTVVMDMGGMSMDIHSPIKD